MRGKRSKQYRKLVEQYQMAFGFREPYQILVDADMIKDCYRQKMDLIALLKRTLHAKEIKPMVTQCCMRHLYADKETPEIASIITHAQTAYARAFCGHHPTAHPTPLSTTDCLKSLVDGKSTGKNAKHYVVATQDQEARRAMREIKGVPLIFERRGVVIMEPMADVSKEEKMREEMSKFRVGLKRKREEEKKVDTVAMSKEEPAPEEGDKKKKKKKKNYGRKQPNPLSVKKPKKSTEAKKAATDTGAAEKTTAKRRKTSATTTTSTAAPQTAA